MKRRNFLLIVSGVFLLSAVILLMWPAEPLDLSKDEEPFKSMTLPPKTVYGLGYMDGGSVAVVIIDQLDVRYEITFPIDYDGIRNAHPTAYNGNINDPKMILLKDPARAKAIAIRLLDEYGSEIIYKGVDARDLTQRARDSLAEPPRAVAYRVFKKFMNLFH